MYEKEDYLSREHSKDFSDLKDKFQKNLLFPLFLYNSSTIYGGIAQLVEQ